MCFEEQIGHIDNTKSIYSTEKDCYIPHIALLLLQIYAIRCILVLVSGENSPIGPSDSTTFQASDLNHRFFRSILLKGSNGPGKGSAVKDLYNKQDETRITKAIEEMMA